MKSACLFLLLGVFTLSLAAQEQAAPALQPAGPNRPAGVPADYVITPFGYFHPSCVLQLNKGEYRTSSGLLHHVDGSETQVSPCQYPHFSPSGAAASSQDAESTLRPAIQHSWIENSSVTTTSAYGKEVSTWKVPPVPLMHDGQTIYLFPGFEDINDSQTSILQPVIGSYDGGQWWMASWNCCLAGTVDESTPVSINAGDTIVGTTEMTCVAGTTSCVTWNVITQDQTLNLNTELTATPSDGQVFNWAFGGVLEVYNVNQCLDYPPNASLTMTSSLYDDNLNLIASPAWVDSGVPTSSVQPQCDYGVTATATQTTLQYGTTAPSFGLGITPAVGIAVNQGSSASGTIAITDINGFTGSVQVSLSSPPAGVTAQLTQGSSSSIYILTLSATSAAPITGTNTPAIITLTASGSGVSTQTFPVNVIVNPPLTGGIGAVVNLAGEYNAYAFFSDAVGWPTLNATDSLDKSGDVYSANQLNPPGLTPMGLNLNGEQFNFGTPNVVNAVYGTGANPIPLPNVQSNGLQLLATAVNGAQKSQTVTVTYTDATTQTFTQTFDDWTTGPVCVSNVCTPGESVAVTMPYNDTEYSYPRNDSIYYLYEYPLVVNSGKTLQSLMLPNNRYVVVLAVTQAQIAAMPAFSLSIGTYTTAQTLTIGTTTPGATIYYTTNGATPTTSSAAYGGAIAVSSTVTVRAIAVGGGYLASPVASATYTLIPTFSMLATAVTVSPGGPGSSTLTISSTDGYAGTVSLVCSATSSPTGAADIPTCTAAQTATLSPTASSGTVSVTVNSTAASSGLVWPKVFPGNGWTVGGGAVLALILFPWVPKRRRSWAALPMLAFALVLMGGLSACGGKGGGGTTTPNPGTTAGNYTITVIGVGNDSARTTATTTFTLTVN
jgi:hypothetical protein